MRHNLDMFSTDHVPLMLSSTQMLGHMVDPYPSTTLADYSRVSFTRHVPLMLSSTVGSASTTLADYSRVSFTRHDVLGYLKQCPLQYLYNIYNHPVFKPFMK